jgi:hypothetical protein
LIRNKAASVPIPREEQEQRDKEAVKRFYDTTHTSAYQPFHPEAMRDARGKNMKPDPEVWRGRSQKEQMVYDRLQGEKKATFDRALEFQELALSGKLKDRPLGINIYPEKHGGAENVYGSTWMGAGGVGSSSNTWKSMTRTDHTANVFSKAHNSRFQQPVGIVPIGKFCHQSQPGVQFRSSGPLKGIYDPDQALKALAAAGFSGCTDRFEKR